MLSNILGSAVKYGFLAKNPAEGLHVTPAKRGTRRLKPFIRPEQFAALVELVPEPYATWLRMVGTDPRDRQSLMRHSRFMTTAEIYEQDLPQSQLWAVEKLSTLEKLKTEEGQ